jgi:hypothetical protein
LERNRVGRDAIDAASALTDMGKYLFLERRLPVYDIAVAITKLDMCRSTLFLYYKLGSFVPRKKISYVPISDQVAYIKFYLFTGETESRKQLLLCIA